MGFFGSRDKDRASNGGNAAAETGQVPGAAADRQTPRKPAQTTSKRPEIYTARVRDGFKGEVRCLQAELQIARSRINGKAPKVTEGEVIEMMLDSFRKDRSVAEPRGPAAPIADEIWHAIHKIAHHQQISPSEVIERLVVQKVAELGLLPRKPT
jgi:hypothetical protein